MEEQTIGVGGLLGLGLDVYMTPGLYLQCVRGQALNSWTPSGKIWVKRKGGRLVVDGRVRFSLPLRRAILRVVRAIRTTRAIRIDPGLGE